MNLWADGAGSEGERERVRKGFRKKPTIPKVSPGSKFETGLKKFAALKP
jgi:hypothetical protein